MESVIKWQTGEPRKGGLYVVTNYKGEVEIDRYEKAVTINYGLFAKNQTGVRAWCKLSDIDLIRRKQNESFRPLAIIIFNNRILYRVCE